MYPKFKVYQGHILEVVKKIPDKIIQTVVTSPPYYGLRDYGTDALVWGGDPECLHEWGEEIGKVKKPNQGVGSKVISVAAVTKDAVEKDYSQGQFCKKCGAWKGSLGLEPNPEMYIQHLVEIFREIKRILRDDGTIWLNLGDSYASAKFENIKQKDLMGIPWSVAFALRDDGWYLRRDIIWAKKNCMPESVTDRPTSAHEYIFLLSKKSKYFYDGVAIKEPHTRDWTGEGGNLTGKGIHKLHAGFKDISNRKSPVPNPFGRNKRSVWTIATLPFPEAHFAVFPEEIPRICIKAGTSKKGCCPKCGAPWKRIIEKEETSTGIDTEAKRSKPNPGILRRALQPSQPCAFPKTKTIGWEPTCKHKNQKPIPCMVLDPFFGSGTTAIVAKKLGRSCIGIELNPEYIEMGEKGLKKVPYNLSAFE